MMILVDTCIWIYGLADREPYVSALAALLDRDRAAGHDLVYGEMLIGDSGSRGTFLANYRQIPKVPMIAHAEVVALVQTRGLRGRGLSWIDVHLLASALASRVKLWTADASLQAAAQDLGVAYTA